MRRKKSTSRGHLNIRELTSYAPLAKPINVNRTTLPKPIDAQVLRHSNKDLGDHKNEPMKGAVDNARVMSKKRGARAKGFKVVGPSGGVSKPMLNKSTPSCYSRQKGSSRNTRVE